jgi:N-methylhydantoinase A
VRFEHTLRMRYSGQTFEVDTPVEAHMLDATDLDGIADAFHRCHETEYGVRSDDFDIEVVGAAVAGLATGNTPDISAAVPAPESTGPAAFTTRQVYFDGSFLKAKVFQFDELGAGTTIEGPAIIEHQHTSVTLPPAGEAVIDAQRNLIMEVDLG